MSGEIERAKKLFEEGNAAALNIAVKELEAVHDKSTDHEFYYQALMHLVKFNYRLGNFRDVINIMKQAEGRVGFPFAHWASQQYIRSFISELMHTAEPESLLQALPVNVQLANCISAVYRFWCASCDNDLVERCFEGVKDYDELVALLIVFSSFSVEFSGDLARQCAAKFSVEAATYPTPAGLMNMGEAREGRFDYLFCCGTPRSGTTALGSMLNNVETVALFTELYNPYLGYSPAMFSAKRYNSAYFERHRHYRANLSVADRIAEHTRYVGDKRPSFLNAWNITQHNFHKDEIRVINLIRDPSDVMASYRKRAQAACQLKDGWSPEMSETVAELNLVQQYREILKIKQGDASACLMLVKYPDILTDIDALQEVFDFLQLKLSEADNVRVKEAVEENLGFLQCRPRQQQNERHHKFLHNRALAWYHNELNGTLSNSTL